MEIRGLCNVSSLQEGEESGTPSEEQEIAMEMSFPIPRSPRH